MVNIAFSRKCLLFSLLTVMSFCMIKPIGSIVMGIDMGTDSLKIVLVRPGAVDIVLDESSGRKTFNGVALSQGGRFFSDLALQVYTKKPELVYHGVSKVLGRRATSLDEKWIGDYCDRYHLVWLKNATLIEEQERSQWLRLALNVGEKTVFLEEMFAQILSRAALYASRDAGTKVEDCAITVPSYWLSAQRQALIDASHMSGLNLLGLINQNAAISLKYMIDHDFEGTKNVIFYDMGAVDLQVSLYMFEKVKNKKGASGGEIPKATLIVEDWDDRLGGMDFDYRIAEWFVKKLKSQLRLEDTYKFAESVYSKVFRQSRRVKEVLSANKEASIFIEGLLPNFDFKSSITREEFEIIANDLFERALIPLGNVLQRAGIQPSQIDSFELFGGGTRVPKLQEQLRLYLHPLNISRHLNTDEAAAFGSSLYAAKQSPQHRLKEVNIGASARLRYPVMVKTVLNGDEESGFGSKVKIPETTMVTDLSDKDYIVKSIKSQLYLEANERMMDILKRDPLQRDYNDELWFYQGICQFFMNDKDESYECFKRAVEINPKNIMAWNNLGIVAHELKRPLEAMQAYDVCLKYQPVYIKAMCNKATILITLGEYDKAMWLVDKVLQMDQQCVMALNVKAWIHEKLGRLDLAMELLDRALEILPGQLDIEKSRCMLLDVMDHSTSQKKEEGSCEGIMERENLSLNINRQSFALDDIIEKMLDLEENEEKEEENGDSNQSGYENHVNDDDQEGGIYLFKEDAFFESKRRLKLKTQSDMIISLFYPKEMEMPDGVSNEIGKFKITWPKGIFEGVKLRSVPTVIIRFELTKNGIVKLLNATANISWWVEEPMKNEQGELKSEEMKNNEESAKGKWVEKNVLLNIEKASDLGLSKLQMEEAIERLDWLDKEDKRIRDTEQVKSDLESLVYDIFERVEDERFVQFLTPEEREVLISKTRENQEWIEERGELATLEELQKHKLDLKDQLGLYLLRISESVEWPKAIENSLLLINVTRNRLSYIEKAYDVKQEQLEESKSLIHETETFIINSKELQKDIAKNQHPQITSLELKEKCEQMVQQIDSLTRKFPRKSKPKVQPSQVKNEKETVLNDKTLQDEKEPKVEEVVTTDKDEL